MHISCWNAFFGVLITNQVDEFCSQHGKFIKKHSVCPKKSMVKVYKSLKCPHGKTMKIFGPVTWAKLCTPRHGKIYAYSVYKRHGKFMHFYPLTENCHGKIEN